MMKTRITALAASVALTMGLFSVVPTMPASSQTKEDALTIVDFCRVAYAKWNEGDKMYLEDHMKRLTKTNQAVVGLACAAYGEGFEDGEKKRTHYASQSI